MFLKRLFTIAMFLLLILSFITPIAANAQGFVFPVVTNDPPDPNQFVYNTTDPLSDGWLGYGVGSNPSPCGHLGQDYYLSSGTEGRRIYAVYDGEVVHVQNDSNNPQYGWCDERSHGWGRIVVIRHTAPAGLTFNTEGSIISPDYVEPDDRYPDQTEINPSVIYTLYGHLSSQDFMVSEGDVVQTGQPIARIGSTDETGYSTPHLHFEIKSQKGFDDGVWGGSECSGTGTHLQQSCGAQGVGSGYSYISGYAPERYNPSVFIPQNANIQFCYEDPISITPNAAAISGHTCENYFQQYHFPVTPDGRIYKITITPITGNPDLYASRYQEDINERNDLLDWEDTCPSSYVHCTSSRNVNGNDIVIFPAPTEGGSYPSWFSVFGESGVNGIVEYSVRVTEGLPRFMDFEDGTDNAVIRSNIPGMVFSTTQGFDWIYGDKSTGKYNVAPYGAGDYACYGNVFAWLGPNQGRGRIDFIGGSASKISLYTSTYSGLWLKAYGANGNLLDYDYVSGNTNTGQLTKLTVSGNRIYYALVHDLGNYWLIDNLAVEDLLAVAEAYLPEDSGPVKKVMETINQGQTNSYAFNNTLRRLLTVILHWFGSEMNLTIYAPDGSVYGEWQSDNPPISIAIPFAETGIWLFDVTAVDVPEENYPFSLVVGATSPPADTTPPVIVIFSPIDGGDYFNTSTTRFAYTIEDPESEIASYTAILDGAVSVVDGQDVLITDLWAHSFTVEATNGVGLTSSQTVNFNINQFVWLRPIFYLDSMETKTIEVIRNSTFPIKFAVFDSSGSFITDTTVTVIVEGTAASFSYGEGDTSVRIDTADNEEPKYIVNLHTNFRHWDYGIIIGEDYWIKIFFSDILADMTKLVVVQNGSAKSESAADMPERTELLANYPNPFNLSTQITYSLPQGSHVNIEIYNILGSKIRTLVDEYQAAGFKTITWDSKDNNNQIVSGGIYFYRVEAGEFSENRKMLLLK